MTRPSPTPQRAALRLARSAPAARLGTVAAAAGTTTAELRTDLRESTGRGPCTRTARVLLGRGADPSPAVLAASCPAALRAGEHADAAGAAVWAARNAPDHRNAPASLLRASINSTDPDVRHTAGRNPALPRVLALRFLTEQQPADRLVAAAAPAAGHQILWLLTTDPDTYVRKNLLTPDAVPGQIVAALAGDAVPHVRSRAVAHRMCPRHALRRAVTDPQASVRADAAANPNCGPDVIAEFAEDPDPDVRRHAAYNPACPTGVLRSLATDPDSDVRWAVALHPAAGRRLLHRLRGDTAPHVREAASDTSTRTSGRLLADTRWWPGHRHARTHGRDAPAA